MRNYQNSDSFLFNIRNMNVVRLFSLGATTDAKDYLRNLNLLEAIEMLTCHVDDQGNGKFNTSKFLGKSIMTAQ